MYMLDFDIHVIMKVLEESHFALPSALYFSKKYLFDWENILEINNFVFKSE